MGILSTIDRALNLISKELIESNVLYIELDKDNYELVQQEVESKGIILLDQKVADIGKCLVLSYLDYKIVITVNKDKSGLQSFYIAFKTKII